MSKVGGARYWGRKSGIPAPGDSFQGSVAKNHARAATTSTKNAIRGVIVVYCHKSLTSIHLVLTFRYISLVGITLGFTTYKQNTNRGAQSSFTPHRFPRTLTLLLHFNLISTPSTEALVENFLAAIVISSESLQFRFAFFHNKVYSS